MRWSRRSVLAQGAALIGIWGLTFLAVAIYASPAVLADDRADTQRPWLAPALSVLVIAAIAAYGALRLSRTPTTYVEGVRLRIMQPNLQQDEKFNYAQKQQVMSRYLALSDRATGPQSTGVRDVTHLIWPESAFPFFLTREADALAQIAALLPEGTVLITGAVRAPEDADRPAGHPRLQFDLRDRPRRLDPVGLRQGPSRSVRRVSAVSEFARAARPDAAHQGARRLHPRRPAPSDRACRGRRASCRSSATRSSFRAKRCRAASGRAGCSTSPMTAGSAPAPVPTSTSSRRACGRSRKGCRWCGPPIPGSRPWSIRSAAWSRSLPLGTEGVLDARLPRPVPPTPYARLGDGPAALLVALAMVLVLRARTRPPSR